MPKWPKGKEETASLEELVRLAEDQERYVQQARLLLEQWARLYRVPDRRAFLQAADEIIKRMQQQAQEQAAMQQVAAGGTQAPMTGPPDAAGEMLQALPPQMQAMLQGGGGQ